MRPERVILEHHPKAAAGGRHEDCSLRVIHGVPAEPDPAGADPLQPCRAAQERRFARAGAADQDQEFAWLQVQMDIVQDLCLVVAFADILEGEKGHEFSCKTRAGRSAARKAAREMTARQTSMPQKPAAPRRHNGGSGRAAAVAPERRAPGGIKQFRDQQLEQDLAESEAGPRAKAAQQRGHGCVASGWPNRAHAPGRHRRGWCEARRKPVAGSAPSIGAWVAT